MVDKDKLARDLYNHFHYRDENPNIANYASLNSIVQFILKHPEAEPVDTKSSDNSCETVRYKGKLCTMDESRYVPKQYRGKIFEITTEPFKVCSCDVVKLKDLCGCYALDGLIII